MLTWKYIVVVVWKQKPNTMLVVYRNVNSYRANGIILAQKYREMLNIIRHKISEWELIFYRRNITARYDLIISMFYEIIPSIIHVPKMVSIQHHIQILVVPFEFHKRNVLNILAHSQHLHCKQHYDTFCRNITFSGP